jgi:acyl-CoA reductase-like NAD-dependent aldehyde dehydrogenase
MLPFTQLYINGKFVPSITGETFEVYNPHSGVHVGTAASASSLDCASAIEAASEAFKFWENSNLNDRRDILLRAAELVSSDKYRVKIVESTQQETAAAPYWANFNWAGARNFLRTHAGTVDRLRGEIYPSSTVPGAQVISQRRAQGVVYASTEFIVAYSQS